MTKPSDNLQKENQVDSGLSHSGWLLGKTEERKKEINC